VLLLILKVGMSMLKSLTIFNLLQFQNSFLEYITFAKNLSKQAACHLQKQKNTVPKFYFLPSKLKLGHKKLFNSYKSYG